jgi:hypothetical protein
MTERRGGWESDDGPASIYSPLGTKIKQIPHEIIVRDIISLVKLMPLTKKQMEELFDAIQERRNRGD